MESGELFWSRARRIQDLERVLQLWLNETDEDRRDVLAEDVMAFLGSREEFTASLRAFAEIRGFDTSGVGDVDGEESSVQV
ncbi:hypothetical protein ACFV9G_22815 [Nocardioides sp. NPDC059952]|uniref:hypothetical protein n=1 Tax=Nocardioides sp. NPDC059952 TaxID=3347014 RepID=UPI00365EA625